MASLIIQEIKQLKSSQKNRVLIIFWTMALLALIINYAQSYYEYSGSNAIDVQDIQVQKEMVLKEIDGFDWVSESEREEMKKGTAGRHDADAEVFCAIQEHDDRKLLSAVHSYWKSEEAEEKAYGYDTAHDRSEQVRVEATEAFRDYMYGYYSQLEIAAGEFWHYDRMVGFNFLYHAMEDAMPIACIVVALLAVVDGFAGEKESGSIKAKLLLPVSKGKLLAARIVGGTLYNAAALFLPLLLLFLLVGGIQGFGSKDYLVLEDCAGIKTAEAIDGKLDNFDIYSYTITYSKDFELAGKYCVGISQFLVGQDFEDKEGITPVPNGRLVFSSIWKFLLRASLYQVLVILFSVSVGNFLSIFANRRGIATAAGLIVALVFCAVPSRGSGMFLISPGTYKSGVGILGGTAGVTALHAVSFLLASLLVLWAAMVVIQRRRDTVC